MIFIRDYVIILYILFGIEDAYETVVFFFQKAFPVAQYVYIRRREILKNLNAIRAEPINGSGTQVAPEYLTVFLSLFNEGEL